MGRPWHFYAVLFSAIIIGNILFEWRRSLGHFEGMTKRKTELARSVCVLAPMLLIGIPYMIWAHSGFRQIDARNVESMMEKEYLAGGDILSADADFIITSRTTMKGHVQLDFANGRSEMAHCEADIGTDGNYLVSCE